MDDILYTIIAKNLDGEATEAERRELDTWLAASPEHVAMYDNIKSFWNMTSDVVTAHHFDTHKGWEKISTRIGTVTPQRRTMAMPAWTRYGLAAAAVLLLGVFAVRQFGNSGNVTIAANEGNMEITLPDQSHVSLRKGSELTYPKNFASNERDVELKGEAFFDVQHDDHAPFIIHAQSADVRVLGTSFNVRCDEVCASVVVRTGKVQMADHKSNGAVILTQGERGILKNGQLTHDKASAENALYWKTGVLTFSNASLDNIVKELSVLKDTSITFDAMLTDAQKQQMINISFSNQPLDDMMNDLCLVAQCQWTKQSNSYIIKGK